MFGKENRKKELIRDLANIYEKIQREHQISPGDFPELKRMQVSGGDGGCAVWWGMECVLACGGNRLLWSWGN